MSRARSQVSDDEYVVMRCSAMCNEGMFPKGLGECVLTDSELSWYSSKSILNVPFNLWEATVHINLSEVESVTNFWFLPSSPLRIKTKASLYGFTFEKGTGFHPLFFLRSRRESNAWRRAVDRLRETGSK